ncbi:LysR substrate-binding domain-containing protein [Cupriavidus sp. L7L]|uniref:LysR substrate-binding domain-containing protein n=1 Tax=Cupriavidus sp. L7L TaxID=2546443 RepID=UPI001055A469|nr:LysR substrate-binding domain-containing protein [Cupriavidus sp. L7L]TDF62662.1 LysR family transcriptional regulator [Cupriavidus sp. L7L]
MSPISSLHLRLPSLNTIAAFEASARLLSFTKAAEELHLSQAAVSRQVQSLEARLGTALFIRRHKEITLTPAGLEFQEAIAEGLLALRSAIARIQNLNDKSVTVSASLAMSSFWLMPAILDFQTAHPDIPIRVLASDSVTDPASPPGDLAIRYGNGVWDDVSAIKLFDEVILPVCSPAFLSGRAALDTAALVHEPLIELDSPITTNSTWRTWFRNRGIAQDSLNIALQLTNHDLVYRAVCAGKGIALGWSYGVLRDLRDGTLIRPVLDQVSTGNAEFLVHSNDSPLSESATLFKAWILDYAASQRLEIAALLSVAGVP